MLSSIFSVYSVHEFYGQQLIRDILNSLYLNIKFIILNVGIIVFIKHVNISFSYR